MNQWCWTNQKNEWFKCLTYKYNNLFFPEWFSSSEQINRVNDLTDSLMNSHLFRSWIIECCWINRLSEWFKILIHKADHLFHSWMNQCCWTNRFSEGLKWVKDSHLFCSWINLCLTNQLSEWFQWSKESLVQFLKQSVLLNKQIIKWMIQKTITFHL